MRRLDDGSFGVFEEDTRSAPVTELHAACARVHYEAEAMRLPRQGDLGCGSVTAEEWVTVLGSHRMLGSR